MAHAIPYRLSLDVSRGGFSLAWLEPELLLRRWLTLRSTLEPVGYRGGHVDERRGSPAGRPRWLALARGRAAVVDRLAAGRGSASRRVAALQDRLALGVGVRDPEPVRGPRLVCDLSVADLNGLVFGLSPLGGALIEFTPSEAASLSGAREEAHPVLPREQLEDDARTNPPTCAQNATLPPAESSLTRPLKI